MFRAAFLIAAVLSSALVLAPARADSRAEIVKMIAAIDHAIKVKDGAALHRIYDPDGHFVGLEGKPLNQKRYVQAVLDDPIKAESAGSQPDVLRVFGDSALEMGTFTATGTRAGKHVREQLRYMTCWTRKNGQWVISYEQLTGMKAPK